MPSGFKETPPARDSWKDTLLILVSEILEILQHFLMYTFVCCRWVFATAKITNHKTRSVSKQVFKQHWATNSTSYPWNYVNKCMQVIPCRGTWGQRKTSLHKDYLFSLWICYIELTMLTMINNRLSLQFSFSSLHFLHN